MFYETFTSLTADSEATSYSVAVSGKDSRTCSFHI